MGKSRWWLNLRFIQDALGTTEDLAVIFLTAVTSSFDELEAEIARLTPDAKLGAMVREEWERAQLARFSDGKLWIAVNAIPESMLKAAGLMEKETDNG